MAIVELRKVAKQYPIGRQLVHALRGVSLDIDAGEFTVVAGPSGSGKTTLLNMIGCMDHPTSGEIYVDGEAVHTLPERRLTQLRAEKLGFVFQSFNLMPVLSAAENVELPLLLAGNLSASERSQRVNELLDEVDLSSRRDHRPAELSGGQQQRVAVARALVGKPRVVLADEPTANLDSVTGARIIKLMRELSQSHGTTFVFSTHDPKLVALADRLVRLEDGLTIDE